MRVLWIEILLEGKYDICKLATLGFQHDKNADTWSFTGNLHEYVFQPRQNGYLRIYITENASHRELPHKITFGNFHDWLTKCVDTIQT